MFFEICVFVYIPFYSKFIVILAQNILAQTQSLVYGYSIIIKQKLFEMTQFDIVIIANPLVVFNEGIQALVVQLHIAFIQLHCLNLSFCHSAV